MKKLLIFLLMVTSVSLGAQAPSLTEKDIPKKVIVSRNKKAANLRHKTATWYKNEAGEFVVSRGFGKSSVEGPEQTVSARFKEDGTWVATETVLDAYNDRLKKRMVPKNIQNSCTKKADGGPTLMGGVTITVTPKGKTFEMGCGDSRATFDAKGKEVTQ